MTNSADGSDLWHGEVEPRSDLAKRFRAGEQTVLDIQGIAEALTRRTAFTLTAAPESWDDDFVFRPAEPSSSSTSNGSTLPGDFSPTSTPTTFRCPFGEPTAHAPLNGHETQPRLPVARAARHCESKWSLASSDGTASPDPDAKIAPPGREASKSIHNASAVYMAPSSSKTRRLQPCSSQTLASATSPSPPCPATAHAEARRSSLSTPAEGSLTSPATHSDDLAIGLDGEEAIDSLEIESRSRPGSPRRRSGTRRKETRRIDGSCAGEDGARSASVEAISAVDTKSSQVSFASKEPASAAHAPRTESPHLVVPGADMPRSSSHSRNRKLVKKRPQEQQQTVPISVSALGLSTDGTSERPLLAPSRFSTSSGGSLRTVLVPARSRRPFADPSRSERPFVDPIQPFLDSQQPRTPRTRSVTTPARSSGATIVDEKDWVDIDSFPPPIRESPSFATPDRRPSLRPLRDRATSRPKDAVPLSSSGDGDLHGSQNTEPSSGIGSGRLARFLGRSVSGPVVDRSSKVSSPATAVDSNQPSRLRRTSGKLRQELPEANSSSISRSGSWSRSIGKTRFSFDRHGQSSPPPVPPVPSLEQLPRSNFPFLAKSRRSSYRSEQPPSRSLSVETSVSGSDLPPSSIPTRPDQTGSTARCSHEIKGAPIQSRPRRVSHRPSASLPSVPSFGLACNTSVTPLTTTSSASQPDEISDNIAERMQASEPPVASDSLRRNTLSDLRIPLRIAAKQKKIQEDLGRVKQFAMAIEGESGFRLRV